MQSMKSMQSMSHGVQPEDLHFVSAVSDWAVAQQRLLPLGATEALPGPRYHALIKAAAHALVRIP